MFERGAGCHLAHSLRSCPTGQLLSGFFLLIATAYGQTCAPSLNLRPTDELTSRLDENSCRLSDGTVFSDYLLTIPAHGSLNIQSEAAFGISLILRDAVGHKLGSGSSVQQPIEAGQYHVIVNATAPQQTGDFKLRTIYRPDPDVLCRVFARAGAGRTITGRLDDSSCVLPDQSRFDGFNIAVFGAGTLDISMASTDFDAYLILRGENGAMLASDDNGGAGTNAKISVPVIGNETYTIVAAAASASEKPGQYRLTIAFTPATEETCRAAKALISGDQVHGTAGTGSCTFNLPDRPDSGPFNFYDLQVATPGIAELKVTDAVFSPSLLLLDADGNPVATDTQSGGLHSPVIRQQLSAGTYRVLVLDNDPFGGDYTLQYSFRPGLPEICPSLTLDAARTSTASLNAASSCRSAGLLADFYRITLPSSGTLDLTAASGDFRLALELRDAKDNQLTSGEQTPDGVGSRVLADLPAGTYSVAAASLDFGGGYGIAYQFTPRTLAPCGKAQALPVNTGYIGLLGDAGCSGPDGRPFDVYTFALPADGTVAAFMTSNSLDSLLTLTGGAGNVLRQDDHSYLDQNAAIVQYLPAGTYRLEARAAGAHTNGLYRVDLLYTQGGRPGFCAATPIGAGDTVNSAIAFTSCQYPDDTFADIYRFNVADVSQALDIRADAPGFDAYLILLDSKGNVIGTDDNSGGGSNARLRQTLEPGIYYVVVKPADDPSSSGKYTLNLTANPLAP